MITLQRDFAAIFSSSLQDSSLTQPSIHWMALVLHEVLYAQNVLAEPWQHSRQP